MNRQNLQKAMDTCLSGLCATPENREAVFRHLRGEKFMKKKMTFGVVLAIVLALAVAGAAIAWSSNLFSVFSRTDPALQYVADHAQTVAPTDTPSAGISNDLPVSVDSAYFDGSSLYLSYRIKAGNVRIEAYAPSPDELQGMQREDSMAAPMLTEENTTLTAFIQNYQAGIAGGYHSVSIGRSDHIATADGLDIPWETDGTAADGEDLLCYIKFVSPLPEPLQRADAFTIQLKFYQTDLYVWFDGQQLYARNEMAQEYNISANITRSDSISDKRMSGQGDFAGKPVTISAVVSPVAITLAYPKTEGLEFAVLDPATGEEAASISVEPQEDGSILQTFAGFGQVPEKLTACPIEFIEPYEGNKETTNIKYLTEQVIVLAP